MSDNNFISVDDNENVDTSKSMIFDSDNEHNPKQTDEIINNIPDWSIEPPIVINRGNDEL